MRRLVWCLWCSVALAVEPAPAALVEADRASAEGLAAYDQAQVEDLLGNQEQAREQLRRARRWFMQAGAILEDLRKTSSDAAIIRRLAEVRRAGRPCCGRPSLWDRYPLEPAADLKR
jgi:hypothetical protein